MRLNKHANFAWLLGLLWLESAMAIEEPRYDVIVSQPPFELRHYAPILIAQTIVEGDMDTASSKGFRLIANYIFGNNIAVGSDQAAKIAMTTPVTVEQQSAKIAMTAPVTIEPQSGDTRMAGVTQWPLFWHLIDPVSGSKDIPKFAPSTFSSARNVCMCV
jgi:hypothetical protein